MQWEVKSEDHKFFQIKLGREDYDFSIEGHPHTTASLDLEVGIATLLINKEVAKCKVMIVSLYWVHISWGWLTNPKEYEKSQVMESLK